MKVNPLTDAMRYIGLVREARDGQNRNPQRDDRQDQNQSKDADESVSFEEVTHAVEKFQNDSQTSQNGLTASLSGSGFGLRVVLKDGSGAVIRQMTGEEFVRLRDESTTTSRPCGKILDQKL